VIDDHSVAALETTATGAGLNNLAAWFVAGDHALVSFRPLTEMLVINGADIRSANG
jgi:hypothetical protein